MTTFINYGNVQPFETQGGNFRRITEFLQNRYILWIAGNFSFGHDFELRTIHGDHGYGQC